MYTYSPVSGLILAARWKCTAGTTPFWWM